MFEEFRLAIVVFHIFAAISAIIAIFLAIKLYRETDKGWYWGSLLFSAIFFAISQWLPILFPISRADLQLLAILSEICDTLAILLFAISCFGMYRTMSSIRKRIE